MINFIKGCFIVKIIAKASKYFFGVPITTILVLIYASNTMSLAVTLSVHAHSGLK